MIAHGPPANFNAPSLPFQGDQAVNAGYSGINAGTGRDQKLSLAILRYLKTK